MKLYGIKYKYRKSKINNGGWAFVAFDEGYITSTNEEHQELYNDLHTFGTEKDAHSFMEKWEGHPWYRSRRTNGEYEVFEIVTPPTVKELQEKLAKSESSLEEAWEAGYEEGKESTIGEEIWMSRKTFEQCKKEKGL